MGYYGEYLTLTTPSYSLRLFEYDPMGRLTSVNFSEEFSTAWNADRRVFEQVPSSASYGIGAGHWRRTATVGNIVSPTGSKEPLMIAVMEPVGGC